MGERRTLSTIHKDFKPDVFAEESRQLMAIFPEIQRNVAEITDAIDPVTTSSWITRSLEYNVPHGNKYRGILTVQAYKSLVASQNVTPEMIKLSYILGWCVEMLNSFFLIYDDLMDGSLKRRSRICWHNLQDVGVTAVNDVILLENMTYALLKKYFHKSQGYVKIMELFHETIYITACGQCMDVLNGRKSIMELTAEKYRVMTHNKTAFHAFYFPVAVAMQLAGVKDQQYFKQAHDIAMEFGYYFQVQNDYLDCYGKPEKSGKIGTDIENNKLSWLALECLRLANDDQKRIMKECYGKNDPQMVERVKQLYKDLKLTTLYVAYEEETYARIKTLIEKLSSCPFYDIYLQMLNKIHRRER
uniref:Farnesyl pyrophosphate synthase n=1 Tax=Stomoxys calcitrans TaxID=35570 RepID=A0A1I8Q9H8_STOCA